MPQAFGTPALTGSLSFGPRCPPPQKRQISGVRCLAQPWEQLLRGRAGDLQVESVAAHVDVLAPGDRSLLEEVGANYRAMSHPCGIVCAWLFPKLRGLKRR